LAAIGVSLLVLRGSFHRVEHVLLALASVFVAYVVSRLLAPPDWGATARGLVVPGMPLSRDAVLEAVATLGTTLAPWGLAFIRSYAADKRLTVEDLRYERVDVIGGRRRAPRVSALLERGVTRRRDGAQLRSIERMAALASPVGQP